MGDLLTVAAQISCTHGGTVQAIPAQSTAADTFIVAGCGFSPGAPSPCITINWVVPDTATTAGGNPTLSTGSTGLCVAATGAVQGTALISSTQTRAEST
jgi:hypothetical protein